VTRKLATLPLCLITLSMLSYARTMSSDEITVRTTYAKLAYAVQLNTLYRSATKTPDDSVGVADVVRNREVHFTLSGFTCGHLSTIANVLYRDLVTKSNGSDALFIGTNTVQFNDETGKADSSTFGDTPKWTKEEIDKSDWAVPMSKAVAVAEAQNNNAKFSRYCAYSVDLSFLGRYRAYKAMFLFGSDAKGQSFVLPADMVVNSHGGSLFFFAQHSIHPAVFQHTDMHNSTAVHDWMSQHSVGDCPADAKTPCCDAASMKCGLRGDQ
jgi:hypothetical protein